MKRDLYHFRVWATRIVWLLLLGRCNAGDMAICLVRSPPALDVDLVRRACCSLIITVDGIVTVQSAISIESVHETVTLIARRV